MKKSLAVLEARYHMWRGVRRFRGELQAGRISEVAIHEMWLGWGNYGWAAIPPLILVACQSAMRAAPRNVIELGSGLSTLALGLIADHQGTRVVSIDHDLGWCDTLRARLRALGIRSVDIQYRALRSYDDHDWYDTTDFPDLAEVGVLLVDGPPGSTHGGRLGALRFLAGRIPPDARVILDDTSRVHEWELANDWAKACQMTLESHRISDTRAFVCLFRQTADIDAQVNRRL